MAAMSPLRRRMIEDMTVYVDDQLEFAWYLNRQLARLVAAQDAIDIRRRAPKEVDGFDPVRHLPFASELGDGVPQRSEELRTFSTRPSPRHERVPFGLAGKPAEVASLAFSGFED